MSSFSKDEIGRMFRLKLFSENSPSPSHPKNCLVFDSWSGQTDPSNDDDIFYRR